jgi:diaminohydroxyphosphoribosylaminopyrimidine deaminase / 5-amino-6-(5-phosphoribosylamino)uracil reductase
MRSDAVHMSRALALAEKGRFTAGPNPLVGCVIVRAGRVVAEGRHERFGGPHAEAAALRRAGRRARGATLYVNLEPCAHWGKTAPCAEAVARAGVRRVVAAMTDPDPRVSGRGFAALRRAGVQVETGLLEKGARFVNRAFLKSRTRNLPYVIYKSAQTLDGRIASASGRSRWITGEAARAWGRRLRAECDAVLVGGKTLRRDDPALTSRGPGPDPLKLVVSSSLDLPPKAKAFQGGAPAWAVTDRSAPLRRRRALEAAGVQVLAYPRTRSGLPLRTVFKDLRALGLHKILVEGGGELAYSLFKAGLVDEVYLFMAPRFLGGRTAPSSLDGTGWPRPDAGPALKDIRVARVGEDILIHGFVA